LTGKTVNGATAWRTPFYFFYCPAEILFTTTSHAPPMRCPASLLEKIALLPLELSRTFRPKPRADHPRPDLPCTAARGFLSVRAFRLRVNVW
jgi:hypothetical protein